ncbi:MAG: glycosyltransferase family 39 protein [Anaerolineales bacterium]|nr:glycosyltransferase family 39 protein [Anaerolineales bacterium]
MFLVLILMGLSVRLIQLSGRPLWYDEAFAVLISREGLGAILKGTLTTAQGSAADVHPPLYYTLLWIWMLIFGEGVRAVRALSVLISIACMTFVWKTARLAFDERVGFLALVLYVLSPFQVHYGQEARMYILLSLLLLVAAWSFLKGLEAGGWWAWTILGITSALAMYTHVHAALFLIALYGSVILLRRRDRLLKVVIAGLIALMIYSPWLVQLPGQVSRVQSGYWIAVPGITEIIQTLIAFNAGLPVPPILMPFVLFAVVLFVTLLFWHTVKYMRQSGGRESNLIFVVNMTLTPILLLYLVSQIWPVFIIRGLLPSSVLYLVWVAWLVGQRRFLKSERIVLGSVIALLFGMGLYSHFSYRGFPYAPFEKLDDYLHANQSEGSIILHSNKISMLPAYYYAQDLPHQYLADKPGSASDTLALPTQEVIGLLAHPDVEVAVAGHDHVFFVVFDREIQDYFQAGVDKHPALEFLAGEFEEVRVAHFGELRLYEFRRPQRFEEASFSKSATILDEG